MIHFWILTLYPATLLNSLVLVVFFWVGSSGFFYVVHLVVCEWVILFFQICMPFILFSCLIAPSRISRMILNRSGKNKHPCFVLNLRGQCLIFHINYDLIVGFFFFFLTLSGWESSCFYFAGVFIIKGGWILSAIFCLNERNDHTMFLL